MEKIVYQSLLYDFYGELLNVHQKNIYEDFVLNNIGISEIAQEQGISRQGVFDMIKRCDKILEGYEDKLHLLEKFTAIKYDVTVIKDSLKNLEGKQNFSSKDKAIIENVMAGLESIVDKL